MKYINLQKSFSLGGFMILLILGISSLLYYFGIIAFAGLNASFSKIWIFISIVFFALFYVVKYKPGVLNVIKDKPVITFGISITLLVGVICFIVIEGFIINGMLKNGEPNLDYIIVLGAQVKGEDPSRVLTARLNTAYKYLIENKKTKVIVSGGQGEGEDISEAEAMKRYLLAKGIDTDRIIIEGKSVNTQENLKFSFALINEKDAKVGIVTSDFHVYRAVAIANKQGCENVDGLAAPVDWGIEVHYMVREFFAVIKEKAVGNI